MDFEDDFLKSSKPKDEDDERFVTPVKTDDDIDVENILRPKTMTV